MALLLHLLGLRGLKLDDKDPTINNEDSVTKEKKRSINLAAINNQKNNTSHFKKVAKQ